MGPFTTRKDVVVKRRGGVTWEGWGEVGEANEAGDGECEARGDRDRGGMA